MIYPTARAIALGLLCAPAAALLLGPLPAPVCRASPRAASAALRMAEGFTSKEELLLVDEVLRAGRGARNG